MDFGRLKIKLGRGEGTTTMVSHFEIAMLQLGIRFAFKKKDESAQEMEGEGTPDVRDTRMGRVLSERRTPLRGCICICVCV